MTRPFQGPDDVIRRLGAVQAQDYAGAKWALAMRMQGAGEAELDRALSAGVILRTHVLRPTWHFVTPADIRWMLKLTHPASTLQAPTIIDGWDWTTPSLRRATQYW